MNQTHFKLVAIFFLGLGLTGLQAQESINSTGGNASGNGGSASYSIGQVAYQIHIETIGSIAEGIQQPYEISVLTAIEEAKGIILSATVYPNPTNDYLTLNINEFELLKLSFQLYDMQGILIQSEKIIDNITSIAVSNLVPSTYFIKIILNNQEVTTFRIIKK